jgi:diguanylate cyclase (GGDEF)-like protein/PAS domain S-box-containing protein
VEHTTSEPAGHGPGFAAKLANALSFAWHERGAAGTEPASGTAVAVANRRLLAALADVIIETDPYDNIVRSSAHPDDLLAERGALPPGTPLIDRIYEGSRATLLEACARARSLPGTVHALSAIRLQLPRDGLEVPTARLNVSLLALADGSMLLGGIYAPAEPTILDEPSGDTDRFYRVYHSSPDAILILRKADHTLLDFNEGFTRLIGYTREDAIGREESELQLWHTAAERSRVFNCLDLSGEVSDLETTLQARDGSPRPVALSLRYLEYGDELCVLVVARDITSRLQAETEARRSEEKFARVFRESPDGIVILRQSDLTIQDVNPAFRLGSGHELHELIGRPVDEFFDVMDVAALQHALEKIAAQGWFRNVEVTFRHVSGKEIPTLVSGALIDVDGEPGVLCVSKNVSELRQAQEQLRQSEERFRGAFENAPIGILLVDLAGKVFQANRFAEDLLKYPQDELESSFVTDLVPDDERESLQAELDRLLRGVEPMSRIELRMRCADGFEIWTMLHIVVQRDAAGDPLYCIMQIADITETKNSQQTMERLAFYDTLTDLANRRLFNERLSRAVELCHREHHRAALLYLDLDQFKRVNDTLGHDSGDLLLREVATRLLNCVRAVDTVARTGGDEFSILLGNVDSPMTAADVARRILAALRAPIHIAGHDLVVTTSIGITLIPDDGTEPTRLLKNADLAMYRAKEQGRNNYQYYSEELNLHATRRLRTEHELRLALERGEFRLHYQPVVRAADRTLVGFECLLRWEHPEFGLLAPGEFIPIAEESGVIIDIGHWIIEEACLAARELVRLAGRPLLIGVNVSPRQFRDARLVQTVDDSLRRTHLDPGCIEFEITETMLMHDIETTSAMVRRLADLGVRVAIDDFGTGYSSLNYLRKFPISTVKVDRSFIRDIPANSDDMAITAAVIAMAHKLNVQVVAEGVETEAQLAYLVEHRCDFAQGYLFGRALDFQATTELLAPSTALTRRH